MGLNKIWLYLIILGIIILFASVGWEVFQYYTEGRSTFTFSISEFKESKLVNEKLENHLNN